MTKVKEDADTLFRAYREGPGYCQKFLDVLIPSPRQHIKNIYLAYEILDGGAIQYGGSILYALMKCTDDEGHVLRMLQFLSKCVYRYRS